MDIKVTDTYLTKIVYMQAITLILHLKMLFCQNNQFSIKTVNHSICGLFWSIGISSIFINLFYKGEKSYENGYKKENDFSNNHQRRN